MYIQEVNTMKLGQGLQAFITKYGRVILDKEGSKWDVFTALETAISQITGTTIEICHSESSYILRGKLLAISDITNNEFISKKAKEKAYELGRMVIDV